MHHSHSSTARLRTSTVYILFGVILLLVIIPLLLSPESEFEGADAAAENVILSISPTTEPWFTPIWEPPGGETESLLFALQAALGAGALGYFIGSRRGKMGSQPAASRERDREQPNAPH